MTTRRDGIETFRRGLAAWGLALREAVAGFARHGSLETSATLTFYGFLAMIPLLLLLIFLLSRMVVASQTALAELGALLTEMLPQLDATLLNELQTLARQRIWSALGLLILFWSITPFAAAVRSAFFRIFHAERRLPFWRAKLRDVGGTFILLALFVLVVIGRIVYAALLRRLPPDASLPFERLSAIWPWALMLVGMALFYLTFAPVRLRATELWSGAAVAATLLFVMRPAFTAFLRFNPNYGYAFGSLKAMFLVLVWVYYCFAVILFGADVMSVLRRREALTLRRLFAPRAHPGARDRLLDRYTQAYDEGDVIFRENEAGAEMYCIVAGSVRLTRGGATLATLSAGAYFGEMALLAEGRRTADAVAAEPDTRLVAVARDSFDVILRDHPDILRGVLVEMVSRLKKADEALARVAAADGGRGGTRTRTDCSTRS